MSIILTRSADIALVAGGSRKRWIIATENMKAGDTILNSNHIGRMAGERSLPDARDRGCRGSSADETLLQWLLRKGMHTLSGPCLWGPSSTTWRVSLAEGPSISELQVWEKNLPTSHNLANPGYVIPLSSEHLGPYLFHRQEKTGNKRMNVCCFNLNHSV